MAGGCRGHSRFRVSQAFRFRVCRIREAIPTRRKDRIRQTATAAPMARTTEGTEQRCPDPARGILRMASRLNRRILRSREPDNHLQPASPLNLDRIPHQASAALAAYWGGRLQV